MGFIITNMSAKPEGIVHFYNGRGTAEQWIKEGKYALNWTRHSFKRFVSNQVRFWLFVLAYRGFCKSHYIDGKEDEFFTTAPYSSVPCRFAGTMKPFPPKGAREVIVPQHYPVPSGGRMSEEHGVPARTKYLRGRLKGVLFIKFDFCKRLTQ